jgi:uncharacterized protein
MPVMTMSEKVKAVEEIFQSLDNEIADFQQWSGIRCSAGCGKCCFKPDVSATVLEFLPPAYQAFRNGGAETLHKRGSDNPAGHCNFLNPQASGGMCGAYGSRGLICRLFGFSARLNKHGKADLITCQIIKTEQAMPLQRAVVLIDIGEKTIPLAGKYYMRLMAIDAGLGGTLYPINTAIKKAIEEVFHYYSYRSAESD